MHSTHKASRIQAMQTICFGDIRTEHNCVCKQTLQGIFRFLTHPGLTEMCSLREREKGEDKVGRGCSATVDHTCWCQAIVGCLSVGMLQYNSSVLK